MAAQPSNPGNPSRINSLPDATPPTIARQWPSQSAGSQGMATESPAAEQPQVARHMPPAVQPSPSAVPDPGSVETGGPVEVEVFFATDRKSIVAIGSGDFLKTFKWPLLALAIASALGLWGVMQRRLTVGIVALLVLFAGVSTGYTALIEWQRLERLAANDDVRYTHELKVASAGEDPLDYGRCLVNIPPDHRVGYVDSPSLQRFEFSEDAQKHVILERVIRGPRDEFFADLNDRLNSSNGQTLVFIHGYNVSFESAVKRTAQVSYDLKFHGVPICYSWPSHGGLEDYTRDMANADWSVVHLQEFLTSLFQETGAERVHVIAHSMGNRALMQALDRLALQWHRQQTQDRDLVAGHDSGQGSSVQELLQSQTPPRFGQIIMAAPDIAPMSFGNAMPRPCGNSPVRLHCTLLRETGL